MEEASELADYLPLSFKTPKEQEHIEFLWDAFETNHTHGKYQFAFLAYHMLTMSFISQHLADQVDDAKRFCDGPVRLRQGHREEPVRHDFALRVQHRARTYPRPSQRLPVPLHHLFLRLERGTKRDLVRHRVAQFDRMAGITQSMASRVELLPWSAGGLAGAWPWQSPGSTSDD